MIPTKDIFIKLIEYINAKIEYEFALREVSVDGYRPAAIKERRKLENKKRGLERLMQRKIDWE